MAATKMFFRSGFDTHVFQIWRSGFDIPVFRYKADLGRLMGRLLKYNALERLPKSEGRLAGSLLTESSSISSGTYPEVFWANISGKKTDFIASTSEITCLAHMSLLQAPRISNKSDPPNIVSFNGSMNHKKFRIKILGFFG
ncbi:hypothetical protein IGI04_035542 [Brassica rapa subsp. trilocularis]|uniref:Uncharacterized protein n=1 Tax=Brassica rapa subsp. trilocularis TaxID=1813537 RepID=A0ABQ7LCU9_BRACM|nr:hypothetical protein IGI04_035542 [Brassica rapa subsp. trilocularis]